MLISGHVLFEKHRIDGHVDIDGVVDVLDLYGLSVGGDLPDVAGANRVAELLEVGVDQRHVAIGLSDQVEGLLVDVELGGVVVGDITPPAVKLASD